MLHFYPFFLFKCIYFNQWLITLQYCIGFAIHQHESATGVHNIMLQRNCPFFCYCSVLSSSYMLIPYQVLVLFHFALGVFFFFLSFSLVYQCLSVVQMKYHILLLPIYCGVLYFGCVLKYNLAMFLGGGEENSRDYGEVFSLFHLH